ncbi:MAG TPA: hypothetical protein VMQ10_12950 [Spirochaetia bacterium]|nr:hypothetical protein [Spirochaetia bacterium]
MTVRARRLVAVLGAALAAAAPGPLLAAQDAQGPADVFDSSAFDQAVQQGTQEDQKAKLETQFGGSLLYDTSLVTTTAFEGYGAAGSFSGKAFVKVTIPETASLYLAYNFSKNLYQGAAGTVPGATLGPAGPVLSQPAGDLYGARYALAEFYAGMDIARVVFLRIGNQLLAWGPSIIWTPVDFVNLTHANPLSPLDLRVGKPGVRATVPLGISNLFVFADLSQTVTPTGAGGALVVNDPVRTSALAARWDLTVAGVELAVTGLTGFSEQSRAGFDFSGRLLGFDVYGEAAASIPTPSSSFTWAASGGLQRTLGELSYWSVAAELYYDSSGTSDLTTYPVRAAAQSFDPFYLGQWYTYASITRSHAGMDGVSVSLAGFADWSDGSFLAQVSTSVDVPRIPPFTVSVDWSGGGTGKAFTYLVGNNSLTLELQVKASF